jgi:hypothetical protein
VGLSDSKIERTIDRTGLSDFDRWHVDVKLLALVAGPPL